MHFTATAVLSLLFGASCHPLSNNIRQLQTSSEFWWNLCSQIYGVTCLFAGISDPTAINACVAWLPPEDLVQAGPGGVISAWHNHAPNNVRATRFSFMSACLQQLVFIHKGLQVGDAVQLGSIGGTNFASPPTASSRPMLGQPVLAYFGGAASGVGNNLALAVNFSSTGSSYTLVFVAAMTGNINERLMSAGR